LDVIDAAAVPADDVAKWIRCNRSWCMCRSKAWRHVH